MEIGFKDAGQLLIEESSNPKLTTGCGELDALIGGIELGKFYLFYGDEVETLDYLIHRLIVNCILLEDEGGFNGKALYINVCNYYERKTVINPSIISVMAKCAGLDPIKVFENIYAIAAFSEIQQESSSNEALRIIREDPNLRLIAIHNLTKFFETSKKPLETAKRIARFIGPIWQTAAERKIALVATSESQENIASRIPQPKGGNIIRHASSVIVYFKRVSEDFPVVKACLVKHPYFKAPRCVRLNFFGGDGLMGRITPSFRQIYQKQIEDLRKFFQNALLDLGHREAFDLLIRDAWTPEDHAMANSRIPYVLDSMNLLANVHNKKRIESLSRALKEKEEEIEELKRKVELLERAIRDLAGRVKD